MVNVTWKKFNQTRSLPKTKVGYNTTMVHGTWKKTKLALDPHRKKICFRFRLQYCFDSWDFRKSISLDHHQKNLLSFPTTVLLWCTVLIQLLIRTWPHRKKLFLATVLDVHETREKISSVLYHRRIFFL